MFATPTSSPQMMRMFGLPPEGAAGCGCCWAWATWVRSTVLMAVAAAIEVPANRILRRLRAVSVDDVEFLSLDPFLSSPSISTLLLHNENCLLFGGWTPRDTPETEVAG